MDVAKAKSLHQVPRNRPGYEYELQMACVTNEKTQTKTGLLPYRTYDIIWYIWE